MHPEVMASLNLQGLGHYISLKYVPAPETMFLGIRALPPAHTLTCDRNGIKIQPYWNLSFAESKESLPSEEACAEQLEALLHESLRLHLVCDVPFGAFLSGGVDSSVVVALMQQVMNVPVKTFSVGFQGGGSEAFSELPLPTTLASLHSVPILFPVHPRTRQRLTQSRWKSYDGNGLRLMDPLPYIDFLGLQTRASLAITDSGGIHEKPRSWECRA